MAGRALLIMASGEARERTQRGLAERCVAVELSDDLEAALSSPPIDVDVTVFDLDVSETGTEETFDRVRDVIGAGLIALGDRRGRADAVSVLRAGADDFIAPPPHPAEVVARVRALLRRLREYCGWPQSVIDLGDVRVDCERHEVTVRGESVELTPKEFDLMRELARSAGELVPREELLQSVWGYDESIRSRTLDVHIGRLRKKIEPDPSRPRLIVTVPRVGYRIAA
ncbi:MAG: winged helix-turn-helix domain-containing protein [Armatimonadota bacterium]